MPPDMPVAVIERGTQPEQRVFTGTLDSLGNIIVANRVATPALLIIGEVAGMYRQPVRQIQRETETVR
jgi:uroporphyrin-III C-methyltransferase